MKKVNARKANRKTFGKKGASAEERASEFVKDYVRTALRQKANRDPLLPLELNFKFQYGLFGHRLLDVVVETSAGIKIRVPL